NKVLAMRQGVHIVVNFGVVLDLAEIIAGVVQMIEGDAKAPNVIAAELLDAFFGESFGAAVKAAGRATEAEVRFILFRESADLFRSFLHQSAKSGSRQVCFDAVAGAVKYFRAGKNAAGRNMAEGNIEGLARVSEGGREKRVALKGIRAVEFAGIDVWLARVAGGVDDKIRADFGQITAQDIEARVINLRARGGDKGIAAPIQFGDKLLSHIARSAKQNNHLPPSVSRLRR